MNYQLITAPVAALALLTLAACAHTSPSEKAEASTQCSKKKSAANGADCSADRTMDPPVVDISKPAPAPGVATSSTETPTAK